jgi:hypothetical protein
MSGVRGDVQLSEGVSMGMGDQSKWGGEGGGADMMMCDHDYPGRITNVGGSSVQKSGLEVLATLRNRQRHEICRCQCWRLPMVALQKRAVLEVVGGGLAEEGGQQNTVHQCS